MTRQEAIELLKHLPIYGPTHEHEVKMQKAFDLAISALGDAALLDAAETILDTVCSELGGKRSFMIGQDENGQFFVIAPDDSMFKSPTLRDALRKAVKG